MTDMINKWFQRGCLIGLLLLQIAATSTPTAYRRNDQAGVPLCLPGVYESATDCLVAGPAAYLTRMARLGLTFPIQPLPAHTPDPALAQVPYRYARITREGPLPLYPNLDAAVAGEPGRYLPPGFNFISYYDVAVVDGQKYYFTQSNEWVWAGDIARIAVPRFQGLLFYTTPKRPFGWILYPTETKRTPGYQTKDYTGHRLKRYDVVQVYASQQVGDYEWYMIGPDEWIEQRLIARVLPNPNPPEGVENGRWIEVNLFEQTLAVYENNRMVFATLVSTGLPGSWTRPGLFRIEKKLEKTPMSGAFAADRSDFYYLQDVPWTMYFDEARALHGAYWHNGFGYPRSHGCVNLAPGDAHWLFNWAREGDWVYVWDPSGRTPTDPSLYTPGGA